MEYSTALIGLGGVLVGFTFGRPESYRVFSRLRSIANSKEPVKMVIAVRQDIGMSPGKMAAQCSHAAVGCYISAKSISPEILDQWISQGMTKIVVKAKPCGEQGLLELEKKAKSVGVISVSVRDAGRTQVARGTMTVIGIGPGPISLVDQVTGHLKVL